MSLCTLGNSVLGKSAQAQDSNHAAHSLRPQQRAAFEQSIAKTQSKSQDETLNEVQVQTRNLALEQGGSKSTQQSTKLIEDCKAENTAFLGKQDQARREVEESRQNLERHERLADEELRKCEGHISKTRRDQETQAQEVERLKARLVQLERENKEKTARLEETTKYNERQRKLILQYESQIQELTFGSKKNQQSARVSEDEIRKAQDAQQTQREQESGVKICQEELVSQKVRFVEALKECQSTCVQSPVLQEGISPSKRDIDCNVTKMEYEETIKGLEDEVNTRDRSVNDLQKHVDTCNRQTQNMMTEMQNIQSDLTRTRRDFEDQQKEKEDYGSQLEDSRRAVDKQNDDLSQCNKRFAESNKIVDLLKKEINDQKALAVDQTQKNNEGDATLKAAYYKSVDERRNLEERYQFLTDEFEKFKKSCFPKSGSPVTPSLLPLGQTFAPPSGPTSGLFGGSTNRFRADYIDPRTKQLFDRSSGHNGMDGTPVPYPAKHNHWYKEIQMERAGDYKKAGVHDEGPHVDSFDSSEIDRLMEHNTNGFDGAVTERPFVDSYNQIKGKL